MAVKWSSQGSPALLRIMRNARKAINDGEQPNQSPEELQEVYDILSRRNKLEDWMIDVVSVPQDEQPQQLEQPEQPEQPAQPEESDHDEVYEPYLESKIERPEPIKPEKLVKQKPAHSGGRRPRQSGMKYNEINSRPIQAGDVVEFVGSNKVDKNVVRGIVVGFSDGAHADQKYCRVKVEYEGNTMTLVKRDYACKLLDPETGEWLADRTHPFFTATSEE